MGLFRFSHGTGHAAVLPVLTLGTIDVQDVPIEMLRKWWDGPIAIHRMVPFPGIPTEFLSESFCIREHLV